VIGDARIRNGVFRFRNCGTLSTPVPDIGLSEQDHHFLLLDALFAIESSWHRKASEREIQFGLVERALLDITTNEPELIHRFDPREFEYFVAALLASLGL
jgi:hypothetical protein